MPDSQKSLVAAGTLALSIGEKITLGLALFALPFAGVVWRWSEAHRVEISASEQERAGLHYLNEIIRAEAEVRSGREGEAVETLRAADARYGFRETRDAAQAVQQEFANGRQPDGAELSQPLADLAARVRAGSGLDADSAPDGALIRQLALDVGPALRERASALEIALATQQPRRVSDTEAGDLLRSLGGLEAAMAPLDGLAAKAAADPDLTAVADKLSEVRRSLSFLTQSVLVQARARRLDPSDTVKRFNEATASMIALHSQSLLVFERRVGEREARLELERWKILIIGALLIAAAFGGVWLALRRSIVKPVHELVEQTGRLAAGDYELSIAQQNRVDEIGGIARFLATFCEIAQSRVRADIARQSAESANLAKSQFLANMSHELRTPLNAIIGYSEILMEDAVDGAGVSDLTRIHGAAGHLLALINDILDVSKIEAGRMELLVEEFDPKALVEDVAATARPLAEKSGAKLIVEIISTPDLFSTDPMKLRQCLLNLVSNACKFTQGGEVHLSVEAFRHDGEPALRFRVADTGIGMTRQQMARLFQPFSQGDETITRQYGGTGLGLMLTKHMALVLGGDVTVTSEKGKGSTFTLWVSEAAITKSPEIAGNGPLVILVEDERDAQGLVKSALAPLGFRVAVASTAAAGLELAKAPDARPALVILDINLPDRPGWSVLAGLKAGASTADVPVVVVSVDGDRRASASLGAAEHLIKPVSAEMLAATVLRLARREVAASEANLGDQAIERRA